MRILFWTESFWPHVGGSEVAATSLIDQMCARGHEFVVITRRQSPDEPETIDYRGAAVHRVPFDQGTFDRLDMDEILPMRQRVAKIKKRFQPQLVHVGLTGPSLFLQRFTRGEWPAPTLVTMHVALVPTQYEKNRPSYETLKEADWVVAVSRSLLEETCARIPEIRPRSSVIYNGLAEPDIDPTPLPLDPPRLLLAGRLVEQKGVDTAIAALAHIRDRFSDATLTIAGDGELRNALEAQTTSLGLSGAVTFLGWTPPVEMPELINRHALVLMPSRWEPFGLVALQAGQLARPTVASNVGGLPEVLRDGETGLLVEPDDDRALADAVTNLLASPDDAIAMGRRARDFVRQTFTLQQNTDAHEALYHRLTASARQPVEQTP